MDEAAFRARVTGRVQGVGFRAFVAAEARALGLRGWVRNEPDGSVSALAAGPAEALARLRAALGRGPPGARVAGVREEAADPGEAGVGFRVTG